VENGLIQYEEESTLTGQRKRDNLSMSVTEQRRKEDKEKAERLLKELTDVSDMLQITVKRYGSTPQKKRNSE
jgi:hypothetical protein